MQSCGEMKSSDLEFGSSGLLQFEPIVRVDLQ